MAERHKEAWVLLVMATDAVSVKIDYIVTKPVSSFARNTVECLATIRKMNVGLPAKRSSICMLNAT